MKLHQLFEDYEPTELGGPSIEAAERFASAVSGRCGEWLRACQAAKTVVWRGIMDALPGTIFLEVPIRQDRRPVDMGRREHELLHKAYLELGLKATRKNSIFCTTERGTAKGWGRVFIIFPVDGWSATTWMSGRRSYTFYNHQQLARESGTVTELANLLSLEDAPIKIDDADSLVPSLTGKWSDILVTGTKYLALRAPNMRETEDSSEIIMHALKLLELDKAKNLS